MLGVEKMMATPKRSFCFVTFLTTFPRRCGLSRQCWSLAVSVDLGRIYRTKYYGGAGGIRTPYLLTASLD